MMSTLFSLSSLLVMPFWLLMLFAPGASITHRLLRSPLVALPPAIGYALLVLPRIGAVLPAVLRPELSSIAPLLGSHEGATIAWLHFLSFDLFVGRWVFLDARERGLRWYVTSPVLFFVLMLGPLGFAAYLALRAVVPARGVTPGAPADRLG